MSELGAWAPFNASLLLSGCSVSAGEGDLLVGPHPAAMMKANAKLRAVAPVTRVKRVNIKTPKHSNGGFYSIFN